MWSTAPGRRPSSWIMPETRGPAGKSGVAPRPSSGVTDSAAAARRAPQLLLLATLIGTLGALIPRAANLTYGDDPLASGVVALVNQTSIRTVEYERAVAMIAADKRDPISDADRRLALDRLIEEELLVQEGLARGLTDVDRRVRQAIVQAMLASILADSRSADSSDAARRGALDAALRDYLDRLRADAEIQVSGKDTS